MEKLTENIELDLAFSPWLEIGSILLLLTGAFLALTLQKKLQGV